MRHPARQGFLADFVGSQLLEQEGGFGFRRIQGITIDLQKHRAGSERNALVSIGKKVIVNQ